MSLSNDEHLLSSLDVEKMAQRDAETEQANKVDAGEESAGPTWWSPRETSTQTTPSRAYTPGVSLCKFTMFTTRVLARLQMRVTILLGNKFADLQFESKHVLPSDDDLEPTRLPLIVLTQRTPCISS